MKPYPWSGDDEWTAWFEPNAWEFFLRKDFCGKETMKSSEELNRLKGNEGILRKLRFLGLSDVSPGDGYISCVGNGLTLHASLFPGPPPLLKLRLSYRPLSALIAAVIELISVLMLV